MLIEILPAHWAPALINGDYSGLEFYWPDEAAECHQWGKESGLSIVTCGNNEFVAKWRGKQTPCLEYYCLERQD